MLDWRTAVFGWLEEKIRSIPKSILCLINSKVDNIQDDQQVRGTWLNICSRISKIFCCFVSFSFLSNNIISVWDILLRTCLQMQVHPKKKKKICKQLHENSDFDTSNSTSLNLGSQYFVTNAYESARLRQRRVAICMIKLICDRSRKLRISVKII